MRIRFLLPLLLASLPAWHPQGASATDTFLHPNDVIALVGGEDMVAADEYGYLEFLLHRALPRHHLKVRCLAWEGDTVFAQPRMLNYPSLEKQLEEIGATVLFTQFGQAEALAHKSDFEPAYDNLLDRLGNKARNEGRRALLIFPTPAGEDEKHLLVSRDAEGAPAQLEQGRRCRGAWFGEEFRKLGIHGFLRDGIHLNELGHTMAARVIATDTTDPASANRNHPVPDLARTTLPLAKTEKEKQLLGLIRAKNRLWANYRRPQNWAFLAGDRTNQPSSHDHLDPSKRWFPEEMKQWLPLIAAKETEIWKLAEELAGK